MSNDEKKVIGHNAGKPQAFAVTKYMSIGHNAGMIDETKGPERLSHEWHAQRCDESAADRERLIEGRSDVIDLIRHRTAEEHRDRAQKLRQAARDAAEVAELRQFLRDVAKGDDFDHLWEVQEQAEYLIKQEAPDAE